MNVYFTSWNKSHLPAWNSSDRQSTQEERFQNSSLKKQTNIETERKTVIMMINDNDEVINPNKL